MIPTRANVATFVQNLLGDFSAQKFVDGAPANGQVNIAFAIDSAFRDMMSQFDLNQIPKAERTIWYNLPAQTSQVTPAQMNIVDYGEIVNLEERNIATTATVSTCNTASPIQVTTTAAHGFSDNQEVFVSGVLGQTAANGRWFITVVNATAFTLNGSVSAAAFVSGGTVTTSTDAYSLVRPVSELPQLAAPAIILGVYMWQEDTFYFVGASVARQLRLTFFSSGTPPTVGSMGVDNCLEPLGYRAAAIVAGTTDMGNGNVAGQLANDANVYMSNFIQTKTRVGQRKPVRPRAYQAGGYRPRYTPIVIP